MAQRRKQKRSNRALWWVLAIVLLAIILWPLFSSWAEKSGLDLPDFGPGIEGTATLTPTPLGTEEAMVSKEGGDPGQAAKLREQLDELPLVSGRAAAGYEREQFGQAWYDIEGNGCDTRNDILERDLRDVKLKGGAFGCKVLRGTLDDWYSGETVKFVAGQDTSRHVQIDHVVPLSWAWHHGAEKWSADERRQFANDQRNLVATTGQMNQSKSDQGPGRWLPSADSAQCRYVQRFTDVLVDYNLGIELRDRAMIRGVLAECGATGNFGAFTKEL